MGAMELQIFVSLLVVLGAAFVALICDFLKGNNEKLREVNIELLVRQEERERAGQIGKRVTEQAQAPAASVAAARQGERSRLSVLPIPVAGDEIPVYPRRRRPARVAEQEHHPAIANANQPSPAAAAIDAGAALTAQASPVSALGMEDWARQVVEHGFAGRAAEPEGASEPSDQVEAASDQIPSQLLPVEVEAVPETIEPELAAALETEEKPVDGPAAGELVEVAEAEIEPPALEAMLEIAAVAPVNVAAQAAAIVPEAILDQTGGRAPGVDETMAWTSAGVGREDTHGLPMGVLAGLETTPAGPQQAAAETPVEPIAVDTSAERACIPDVATVELAAGISAPAAMLPIGGEAVNMSFAHLADVVVTTNEPECEPEVRLLSGLETAPPDWTVLNEMEPAAESGETVEPAASVAEEEGAEPEQMAGVEEPAIEEVVRVRVLDESDLIELRGLLEIQTGVVDAGRAAFRIPTIEPLRFEAGAIEGVVHLPRMGAAVVGSAISAEVVAHVEQDLRVSEEIETPASTQASDLSATSEKIESEMAATAAADEVVEEQPEVIWAAENDQDSEARLAAAEIPLELDFIAPPLREEIEPVQTYERFLDVDTDLELSTKVVQMPSPAALVDEVQQSNKRLPRGIHDRQVLSQMLERQSEFNGVVFLLGLLGYEHLISEHGQAPVRESVDAANKYFDSLLGDSGFGCWTEESTFLMLLPTEGPEEAREISQQTAEALWDYQLRSLGSTPLIFHWGCSIVEDGNLPQSIELAKDQMLEAGRARKRVLSASGRFRRKVVNG